MPNPGVAVATTSLLPMMMMMSLICSCRNKNQPKDIYPKGTSHHTRLFPKWGAEPSLAGQWLPAAGGDGTWAARTGSGLVLMRGEPLCCIARWRGRLLSTGHPAFLHPVIVGGGLGVGVRWRGGRRRGRVPGAVCRWPRGAARRSCVCDGLLPRARAQLAVRVSTGGLPLMVITRGCLRVCRPGDAHAL
jgi:hypothetical protein